MFTREELDLTEAVGMVKNYQELMRTSDPEYNNEDLQARLMDLLHRMRCERLGRTP
jgi:hypothetical protein